MRHDDPTQLFATALNGNIEVLRRAAELDAELVVKHRLAPALALRATRSGIEYPSVERWRHELRQTAALQLLLEDAARRVAQVLEAIGISWLPLKGFDLASRVYDEAAERPMDDLDLLIRPGDLDAARAALCAAGWRDLVTGSHLERYLVEEGYAWQAVSEERLLLELHFRLWGLMPDGYAAEIFERSSSAPELGATARRSTLADAFVIAAVHLWSESAPRAVGRFWDLARIASSAGDDLIDAVDAIATRQGLALPVAAASEQVARLWSEPRCRELATRLAARCRWSERPLLERARRGFDRLPFAAIVLARLLAGRPSRAGWRSVWRRLWPHAALVESATSASWSWPRRRAWHLWKNLRGRST